MGMSGLFGRRLSKAVSGLATGVVASALSASAFADVVEKSGQPTDKAMGFQPAATELAGKVTWFYDGFLFWIITAISLFVLALLVWIVIRYNKKANPVPAKFSHNTFIEIVWTVVPVLILVVIAVFSLRLLKDFNDMPPADVVVKATGNQWFWTYDYPELGVTDVESRLLPEASDIKKAEAAGVPYLLEVDNKLVVPVNRVVHIQTTGADVIHAFAVPAFRIKIDAVPGRLNNTWFKATKTGTYYGQCSELCGKDHAFMPIEVQVVTDAEFDAFILKNGGKTKAMLAQEAALAAEKAKADAAAASLAASSASASVAPAGTSAAAPAPAAGKPASTPAPAAPSPAAASAAH